MVDTQWLKTQSIDSKSIYNYVARGWLERIVRGVYRRPAPEDAQGASEVSWNVTLLSLQRIMRYGVHLGGESALDLAGYSHYLSLGGAPQVHFYGAAPTWLKRLPTETRMVVHRTSLFGGAPSGISDADTDAQEPPGAVNVWRWPIRASSPERAILEALDELPNHASFNNLGKIFEGLSRLRPKCLMKLLALCRSVKVRRLFFVFADRYKHPWRKHLDTSRIDFGSGPRALVEGGRFHRTYRIYVPGEFAPSGEDMSSLDG